MGFFVRLSKNKLFANGLLSRQRQELFDSKDLKFAVHAATEPL
jgi:hypothetical protein